MLRFAKLDEDKNVIPCDVSEYAAWVQGCEEGIPPRRVGRTQVGTVDVSTVFLTINHGRPYYPLWFETMLFEDGGEQDQKCTRYATYEEALAGHKRIVAELKATGRALLCDMQG